MGVALETIDSVVYYFPLFLYRYSFHGAKNLAQSFSETSCFMRCFLPRVALRGLFLLSVFFAIIPLSAQGSLNGLTVSPAFQEIVLDQKDIQKDFFVSLSNTSQGTVLLRVAKYDFGTLDESGGVAFLGASNDLEKKYALASWMYPEKDILTLGPGETQKILVTVENSETLGPGGHYGALTFSVEDASPSALGREGVSVNQLFSTLVFVKKIESVL